MTGEATLPAGHHVKLKLQIWRGNEIAMGPGKADLLDAIAAHGSISAAAKAMGMSYRRAWLLVDAMNRCWNGPLVETVAGGSQDRGARLTSNGKEVGLLFRELQSSAEQHATAQFEERLARLLAPVSA